MTETLGWGDVDVEEAPRRRQFPARVAWLVVILLVAGVALTPVVHRRLASSAAAWLQRQWATAKAYDGSRQSIETATVLRLGVGDAPLLAQVIQALDRSEAADLSGISRGLARRRTWSGDVRRTADVVRRALSAEAGDLLKDAERAPAAVAAVVYPPTAMSSATQGLVQEADSAVNAMSRRRHLAQSPTSSARLSAAAPFVARLSHVTDMAVDARLALLQGSSLEIWDLRTGRHARLTNAPPVLEGTSNGSPPVVVGNSLLLVGVSDDAAPSAAVLLPLDGGPAVPLPATTVGYAPAGGDGVWLFTGDTVRRYDTHGKPVGPARPVPHGAQVGGLVGTADTVVLNVGSFDATPHTVLWHPASGRQQVLNADCGSGMAGARRTVVFVDCSQRSIDATDVETGEMRRVRLPRGLVADGIVVAAPDGRRAAFSVSRIADDSGVNDPLLAIVDFGTRAVTVLARPATALCWSADGLTLLAQTDGSSTVDTLPPLGYWSTGMRDLGSIRVAVGGRDVAAAFVP